MTKTAAAILPTFLANVTEPVAKYLVARATAEVLREKVDGVKSTVLAGTEFFDDDGHRVTRPALDWTICDSQWSAYHAEVEAGIKVAAPHDLPAGYCPALVAENAKSDAESVVIAAVGSVVGFDGSKVYNLERRAEIVDNAVRAIVAAGRVEA